MKYRKEKPEDYIRCMTMGELDNWFHAYCTGHSNGRRVIRKNGGVSLWVICEDCTPEYKAEMCKQVRCCAEFLSRRTVFEMEAPDRVAAFVPAEKIWREDEQILETFISYGNKFNMDRQFWREENVNTGSENNLLKTPTKRTRIRRGGEDIPEDQD